MEGVLQSLGMKRTRNFKAEADPRVLHYVL